MHTVLFDIDGTLIRTGRSVREAFHRALRETFGFVPQIDGYSFGGKTDPQIVRELMTSSGLTEAEVRPAVPRCLELYLDHLAAMLPGVVHGSLLPGVRALVDRLAARGDVALGLLTGNMARGARLKLEPLGLWECFAFGAYADVSEVRVEVARHAVDLARGRLGAAFSLARVTVVGDTEHDVACAQALGVRAVAVATGTRTSEVLAAEKPDVLLPDLADAERAEHAILVG